MTYEEFRRQLGKAGLSVKAFAELIKQNPNSISNHAVQGGVPSHIAVIAALMAEMAEHGVDYRAALIRIDFSPSKPRGRGEKGNFGGSKVRTSSVTANL
ncbi:XRE family transcriptional regulator [Pseudomonas corrugata]|uniref:XRE family transcriptional regulator n=1 Tax=Pseudomonas corrugata TaxID=47879 RepID=A0A7Y6DHW7_9PSED|nr:XRE family transcriptional regulator [Pseudomonas corrugata]NUT87566.1 XRE family transcriptional regulator [Pseudomonas corrugata]